jgi:hypothetical protein
MTQTKTGYVVQMSDGQVRLFASREAAEKWEAKQSARLGIVDGCEVTAEKHVRGKIPWYGVRFTNQDQSTGQLLAAMHNGGE